MTEPLTLIFHHIGKTGGMTLRDIVTRQYPAKTLYEFPGGKEMERLDELARMKESRRKKIRCLMGHWIFGVHEHVPGPYAYMTMLRDPVDRTISNYYYITEFLPGTGTQRELVAEVSAMSLAEFAANEKLGISNFQTLSLSGERPGADLTGRSVTRETFLAAEKNLRAFAAVGMTELFDESLALYKSLFGWKDISYKKINVTPRRPRRDDLPAAVIREIEARNEFDIMLYGAARAKFEKEAAAFF